MKGNTPGSSPFICKEIIDRIMEALYEFAKDGNLKRHNGVYADAVSILVLKKLQRFLL